MNDKMGYRLLVVDDIEANRDVLKRRLERQGYAVDTAEDGCVATEMIEADPSRYDLILLDIMMPCRNGYEVLEHLKSDDSCRHIPVIMISAVNEIESIVRCIKGGAEDYLSKPFDPTLLKARIGATLERKRLRDQEKAYLQQIEAEKQRSDRLLLNVLPRAIADRLKAQEAIIADSFTEASVLFADIVDFTRLTYHASPQDLIRVLNEIFTKFDELSEQFALEKIKTIGDSYMVVGGIPTPSPDHLERMADMALAMQEAAHRYHGLQANGFSIRIGMHVGPVIAGVIGTKKFIYDLWGETVNIASRMESHGIAGKVQVSRDVRERLKDRFVFEERGTINLKGIGEMATCILTERR